MSDSGNWMMMAIALLLMGGIDCAMIESHRQHGTGPFKGCVCAPKELS
jgi:hypothetical protein